MSDAFALGGNQLCSTDAEFLEAERELAEVRAERNATEDKQLDERLYERMWALYEKITLSPPVSLASAAVKLRLLMDPDIGIDCSCESDLSSLRLVLEFIVREPRP